MHKNKPFYITTGISYPNGPPHIGHAYEVITTDVIARFMRLAGRNVFFLTGTDDHGQKVYRTARDKNMSPKAFADSLVPKFRSMGEQYLCSFDDFIRTSESRHHKAVQVLWQKLVAAGYIFMKDYEGWYSVSDENYVGEDELLRHADGKVTDKDGKALEFVTEPCYHFRLSAWQDRLLAFYDAHPDFLQPAFARAEVLAFIRRGLRDIAVSRSSFPWGVSVPDDERHIVYVWLDALTNYITGVGYPNASSKMWQTFWPANVHIIGKDITRFHGVFWPAFLMAAGLPCPQQVYAHGFITNIEGKKMSKSVGNVLDAMALLERYGPEAMRFFLIREIPFGRDGQISHDALCTRYNTELANDLGNLAQRCLRLLQRNFAGKLVKPTHLSDDDKALWACIDALKATCIQHMASYDLYRMLESLMSAVGACNRYFAKAEPWKAEAQRQAGILYVTAEALRQLAILLQPILPKSMAQLLDTLGVAADARNFDALGAAKRLPVGSLPEPKVLFPRMEPDKG